MLAVDPKLAELDFCYLTTIGRSSGRPREIEIWFGVQGETLYMLSGGRDRSDWVRNAIADPAVTVRIDGVTFDGRARVVSDSDEDAEARRLLLDKYGSRYGGDLSGWGRDALPVAVDLASAQARDA